MTLEVTVLDKESGPLGTITISFSEGTVIDASTDQEGAGYVVVKEDTEAVDLLFVLCDDGSIQCDLDLGGTSPDWTACAGGWPLRIEVI